MSETERKNLVLQNQMPDYVASAAKALLGAAPFAGSLLAEIAGAIIPNQRVERLAKFAVELDRRIEDLDHDFIRAKLRDENFTDLVEETMRYAARATTNERCQYLAALLANGVKSTDIDYIELRHLLRILGDINDIEVIWLRSYLPVKETQEFRAKHTNVLNPVLATMQSDQIDRDKAVLQISYKEHLSRIGVLDIQYQADAKTKQPIFDSFRGGLKIKGYKITGLGRLLLRYVEQIDASEQSSTPKSSPPPESAHP